MNIFEQVKNELGAGPDYPSRSAFTKYFAYKAGEVLGKFDTRDEANAVNPASVEKSIDKEAYNVASAAYRDHQAALVKEFVKRLRDENSDLSDEVFNLVYAEAYERGHSAGYGEVEMYVSEVADFARKVRTAA